MSGGHSDERRVIGLFCRTAIVFVVLAAARLIYIAICATPLQGTSVHLLLAAPALAIGAYYTFWRFSLLPATLFNGLGLAAFGFTGNVISTILTMYTGRRLPLADPVLAAADHAIGFDWVAALQLLDRYPVVNSVLTAVYETIVPQILLVVVILALTNQAERLCRFLIAVNLALAVTSVIAVFFPALGPYEFYGVSAADHPHITLVTDTKMTAPILWLRAGEFAPPMPSFTVGLISFPSFHTTTALIYAWAVWRTPILRWIWLALNTTMLIATPLHGSHYLVDVIGGAVVAWIGVAMAGWLLDLGTRSVGRERPALAERKLATH
jgi:hypothetical protein